MNGFSEKWDTIPEIDYNQLKGILELLYSMEDPPSLLIFGPPGVGKTRMVEDFAKSKPNLELRIKFLSRTEPTDWLGIPRVKQDEQTTEEYTTFITPKFLKGPSSNKRLLFFFDEINTAPPQVLNSALDVILSKRVEDYQLPKNTMIVAAGNYGKEDGTYVEELSKAVKTRFLQVRLKPDIDQWINWAEREKIHEKIIDFLRGKSHYLLDWESLQSENAQQIATPRGWEKLSDLIKKVEAQMTNSQNDQFLNKEKLKLIQIICYGTIGKKIGEVFYEFYLGTTKVFTYINLPVDDIINKISTNEIPLNYMIKALVDAFPQNPNLYGKKIIEILERINPAAYGSVFSIINSNEEVRKYIQRENQRIFMQLQR